MPPIGYGDITLGHIWRLFGAMAAVNGLLTFGLSTAFLIEVFASSYGCVAHTMGNRNAQRLSVLIATM